MTPNTKCCEKCSQTQVTDGEEYDFCGSSGCICHKPQQECEAEIRQKLPALLESWMFDSSHRSLDAIISLIRSFIEKAREEAYRKGLAETVIPMDKALAEAMRTNAHEVEDVLKEIKAQARADTLSEIYDKLPKKEFPSYAEKDDSRHIFSAGRNSAIDQVQELLKPSNVETSTDGPN